MWRGLFRPSYVGRPLVTVAIGTAVLCQKCPLLTFSFCYFLKLTCGGCVGWYFQVSRTFLSWLALSLCQSGSLGTRQLPASNPSQRADSLLIFHAHLPGALWAGPLLCTTAPSCCSRAELVAPRASPAAVLLREKASLAGRPTPCSAPQKSQGWLVERFGR